MEEHAPAGSDAPANFENAIIVKEAEERMRAAGVPRHEKSIERYCRLGQLRGVHQMGGSGEWLIDPNSLEELIVFLKQIHRVKNTRPPAPASSSVLRNENQGSSSEQDPNMLPHAGASADAPGGQIQEEQPRANSGIDRYIEQLEIRIAEKDETIDFLKEELTDRRGQIKGMNNFMEQNHGLLATINGNIAPLFKAIAASLRPATVETAKKEADAHVIEPNNFYTRDPEDN